MMLASSALFVNCTSDPIAGPDGIAGIDGTDGIDGINGLDSTEDCRACHSSEHLDPIKESYAISMHGIETTMYNGSKLSQYGNRAECAACHTNQGFVDRFNVQDLTLVGPYSASSDQSITCNGCHNPIDGHRSFDFDTDEQDFALRTIAPVTLIIDESVTLDAKNEVDKIGASNTCIACHQPTHRPPSNTEAQYTIDSGHWGPHHGPQATLVEGILGYEYSNVGISAPGSSEHSSASSCVACHMIEGDHSWVPAATASVTCTECHDEKIEVAGFEPDMLALAAKLELVEGWEYRYSIVRDDAGQPVLVNGKLQFLDSDGDVTADSDMYVIELDDSGDKMKDVVIGVVNDGSPNAGFYGVEGATFTSDEAGAAFNYLYLTEDKSKGVHNPNYAKALIAQSLNAL